MTKAKNTEERILEAAIKIFSEKGFSAATTSEIAKEAKVAEGTIFRYFPKKKELLHGIVLKAIDLFGQNVVVNSLEKTIEANKRKDTAELLKAIIMDRVSLFEEYFPYIKVIFYEIQFHDDVRELFFDKIAKELIKIGKQIFNEGKKRGEFRDINPFIAARSFVGMAFMMIMQRQFFLSETVYVNIEDEIEVLIDIFLNGIRKC